MLDFNDAGGQRQEGIIPDGTFALVGLTLRPGEANLPGLDPTDDGLFRQSKTSDVLMLDVEITVLEGRTQSENSGSSSPSPAVSSTRRATQKAGTSPSRRCAR